MFNFQQDIFPAPAVKNVLLQPIHRPYLFAPQWVYGVRSFSDWIQACFEFNKGSLSYTFGVKLEKTVLAIREHEKRLVPNSQPDNDPMYDDPYYAYSGYVAALADVTSHIKMLPQTEQTEPFLATMASTFEQRRQISLQLAKARVNQELARKH